MKDCVCVADLGSTAIKVGLLDQQGDVVAFVEWQRTGSQAAGVSFDAEEEYQQLCRLLQQVLQEADPGSFRLVGFTTSSQRATVVPVTGDGSPSGPAISWQDTAGETLLTEAVSAFGTDNYRSVTGLPCSGIWSVASILACREYHPDWFAQTARFEMLPDYIMRRLGADSSVTDLSNASTYGLLDVTRRTWSKDLCRSLDIPPHLLPELAPPGTLCGSVSSEAAEATGLPEGLPLYLGGGDQQCAASIDGAVSAGHGSLCLGTAAVATCPLDHPVETLPPGIYCTVHTTEDTWLLEGIQNAFGGGLSWAVKHLGLAAVEDLLDAARSATNETSTPVFLPFMAGIGSPDFDAVARGGFLGVSHDHGRSELALACLQGVCLEAARVLEAFSSCTKLDTITVSGGLSANPFLLQTLADLTGRELQHSAVVQSSLLGAAAIAWKGAGAFASISEAVSELRCHEHTSTASPKISAADRDRLRQRYARAVDAVRSYSREVESVAKHEDRGRSKTAGLATLSDEELVRIRTEASEFAGIGIYRYTFDGVVMYIDRGAMRVFDLEGIYPDPESLVGANIEDLLDYLEPKASVRNRVKRERELRGAEYHFRTLTGKNRWVRHDTYMTYDHNLKQNVVQAVIRDVTAWKETTEEKDRLIDIIEHTSDFVAMAAPDRSLIYVNPAGRVLLGWDADETVAGKTIHDLHSDSEHQKILEVGLPAAVQQERWTGETEILDRSGRTIPVSQVIISHKNERGEVAFFSTIMRDLTEQKRAEDELRRQKQFIDDAINSLPGIFYLFTHEGRMLRWNRNFETVSGYTTEEINKMHPLEFFPAEEKALIKERIGEVFTKGESFAEAHWLAKDGTRTLYHLTGVHVDLEGTPCQVGMGIDISDRKRAEEEREKLESQLRQSQKMEAVGQLAGGVAHDFNNILTTILGNVEMSMDSLRKGMGDDHPVINSVEQIERAAQRASTLTRQLLTFSRRDIVKPTILNLNQVLLNLDQMLRRLITEDITLIVRAARELATVRADAGQLEQVIVNLAVNAVHAMPNGGRLVLETRNETLDEEFAADHPDASAGPHVVLAVSDTGHGMDAVTRERIFEPFFTTKDVDKGTGLGLATVHGIVNRLGGCIMVYSEPGHGTTFRIYLPTAQGIPSDESASPVAEQLPSGSATILLCEDDVPVRDLIARVLRSAGYTVIITSNGQEGIQAADANIDQIDLLLTDVIMPDINGRSLADHLHTMRPTLPALFISGYTSDIIARHGVLDEGVEFLEKPFTRQGLLSKVSDALKKSLSHD